MSYLQTYEPSTQSTQLRHLTFTDIKTKEDTAAVDATMISMETGDEDGDTEISPLMKPPDSAEGGSGHNKGNAIGKECELPRENMTLNPNGQLSEGGRKFSVYSLGSTGFSQSDLSLNGSGNPSYCYGNQTEYTHSYKQMDVDEDVLDVPQVVVPSSSCEELLGPKSVALVEGNDDCNYGDYINLNYEGESMTASDSNHGNPTEYFNASYCDTNDCSSSYSGVVTDNNTTTGPCEPVLANQIADTKVDCGGVPTRSSSLKRCNADNSSTPGRKSVSFSLDFDDEEGESINGNERPSDKDHKRKGDSRGDNVNCRELMFLLGEEFEGMEPTYV